jgi:Mn2+/Fe2+ NRAMP family transporter
MAKKKISMSDAEKMRERYANWSVLALLFELATVFAFTFIGAMMATGAGINIWIPLLILGYAILKISVFCHKQKAVYEVMEGTR